MFRWEFVYGNRCRCGKKARGAQRLKKGREVYESQKAGEIGVFKKIQKQVRRFQGGGSDQEFVPEREIGTYKSLSHGFFRNKNARESLAL